MGKLKEILKEQDAAPVIIDPDWQAVLIPEIDFLPGTMLEACPPALAAVQRAVEAKVHRVRPSAYVQWSGTHAALFEHGVPLGQTEVHGATWKRGTNEVGGVRIDLGFINVVLK